MKNRPDKYKFWASKIDGTKSALQIAKELNVPFGTVYCAAKRYNLPLPRVCDLVKDYAGVSLEQYKEELKTYTLGDVVWCAELDKEMSEATAKSINHCKHFVFCEMDVFNPESGKYKPRKEKPKNNQPTLFD